MGLSPYATNTYSTDSDGTAQVMAYPAGIDLNITATGYEIANVFTIPNQAVLKLKKRQ